MEERSAISRRSFIKEAGIGALSLATAGTLKRSGASRQALGLEEAMPWDCVVPWAAKPDMSFTYENTQNTPA